MSDHSLDDLLTNLDSISLEQVDAEIAVTKTRLKQLEVIRKAIADRSKRGGDGDKPKRGRRKKTAEPAEPVAAGATE